MAAIFKSILDEYQLDTTHFELCIAVGSSKKDIMDTFGVTTAELDQFCMNNYGLPFNAAYLRIHNSSRIEYMNTMRCLSTRGNTGAMAIMKDFVLADRNKDNTVKIQFVNKLDKEDNDEY